MVVNEAVVKSARSSEVGSEGRAKAVGEFRRGVSLWVSFFPKSKPKPLTTATSLVSRCFCLRR